VEPSYAEQLAAAQKQVAQVVAIDGQQCRERQRASAGQLG
jgi:hypothetical protein